MIKKLPAWPCALLAILPFAAILLLPATAFAQVITVSLGSQLSLNSGSLSAGCGDLVVAGTLSINSGSANNIRNVAISSGTINGGSGQVNLSGDWVNQGTFNAQTGTVTVTDGCGTSLSQLSGDTTFNRFVASTALGKQLQPAIGSMQTFAGGLTLNSTGSDKLLIRSSSAGATAAFTLNQGASQSISGINVQDIDSSAGKTIAPGSPAAFNSVDAGNNSNWFISAIQEMVPVNTLPTPMLVLLAILLAILGVKARLALTQRLVNK